MRRKHCSFLNRHRSGCPATNPAALASAAAAVKISGYRIGDNHRQNNPTMVAQFANRNFRRAHEVAIAKA
jgi:hypothetical protein